MVAAIIIFSLLCWGIMGWRAYSMRNDPIGKRLKKDWRALYAFRFACITAPIFLPCFIVGIGLWLVGVWTHEKWKG